MDISEHIKSRGLSRAKICEDAGISRAYLSLIENKQRSVGVNRVSALADALGVPIEELRPDLAEVFAPAVSANAPQKEAS